MNSTAVRAAVKRLDLQQVFGLQVPASQQAYRHLDQHFIRNPRWSST